ncbi:MAG: hypothetical protein FWE90_08430 [Defluviitaleaceae bacterium]|nr:hypothetical protein [Defluviitaleaceae bacterium]
MKRLTFLILLASLLLITSCGSDAGEENKPLGPVLPRNGGAYDSWSAHPDGAPRTPLVRDELRGITIHWGYNTTFHDNSQISSVLDFERRTQGRGPSRYHEIPIVSAFNAMFSIQLQGVFVPNINNMPDPPPDIFLANPFQAETFGLTRTIPESMIRRYAPNYAALLDLHNGWGVSRAENGEQLALNTFESHLLDLEIFSVYRLEWLEMLDIGLPGTGVVTQVAEGVYFTPESYTYMDFLNIMEWFTFEAHNPNESRTTIANEELIAEARKRTWGMEVNFNGDMFRAISPILGMHGANTSIMEEDGKAVPFYASRAYKDTLLLIEELAAHDAILVYSGPPRDNHVNFTCAVFRVGWAPVHIRDLSRVISQAQFNDPARRFLITPPEHGINGHRGAGSERSGNAFNANGTAWVIGADVDDDTLSRILNIFDALSFDPEAYVLANYGLYRESPYYNRARSSEWGYNHGGGEMIMGHSRIVWDGVPLQSSFTVRRPLAFQLFFREGVFATGIHDGNTLPRDLTTGFGLVADFAQSDAGVRLNLLPTRADTDGIFTTERARLDNLHRRGLLGGWSSITMSRGVVPQYLMNVMFGWPVERTWNDYLDALHYRGLQAYIDLFSQFPTR